MGTQLIAALILSPFAVAFVYAGVHEYQRFKSDGTARYGLVYDAVTGTSHVTGMAEGQDGYDPDDFDPGDHQARRRSSEIEERTG